MAEVIVVTLPGDGIGRIVLPEALRLLDAVGFRAQYVHADIGWDHWIREGNPLPPRTIELLERHALGLLGAVTSKPKEQAEAELAPELRERGLTYFSPILALRQRFGLDLCIRPCRSFPGNPLNYVRRTSDGGIEEPVVDVVIFRQNTEGLYTGVEWTDPPTALRDALALHPRFAPFRDIPGPDLAVGTRIFTRAACRRLATAAFAHARGHGYPVVNICEKPSVLRETSGMLEQEARWVHADFPEIELLSTNIDAQMMWLTKAPERRQVIVAGNMFGDIVSDAYAGLIGGLGFAASANLGETVAIFEPTHGSAPRYAGRDPAIVNPLAMFVAAAMLVDHAGDPEKADRLRRAVAAVIREGRVRTFDMLRLDGETDVRARGAASTREMTDAVISRI